MRHQTYGIFIALCIFATPIFSQNSAVKKVVPTKAISSEETSHRPEKLRQELGLTEEQIVKLQQIKKKHRAQIAVVISEIQQLRQKLIKNYKNQSLSESISIQIGDKHRELSRLTRAHLLEIDAILNDEQMRKFIEKRSLREQQHPSGRNQD